MQTLVVREASFVEGSVWPIARNRKEPIFPGLCDKPLAIRSFITAGGDVGCDHGDGTRARGSLRADG